MHMYSKTCICVKYVLNHRQQALYCIKGNTVIWISVYKNSKAGIQIKMFPITKPSHNSNLDLRTANQSSNERTRHTYTLVAVLTPLTTEHWPSFSFYFPTVLHVESTPFVDTQQVIYCARPTFVLVCLVL